MGKSASGPDGGCHRAWSRPASTTTGTTSCSGIFTLRGIRSSSSSSGSGSGGSESLYGSKAGAVRLRMDGIHNTATAATIGGGRRPVSPRPLASVCGAAVGVGARRGKADGTTPGVVKEGGRSPAPNGEQPKVGGIGGVAPAAADSSSSSSVADKGAGGGSSTSGASGGSGGGGGGVVGDLPHQMSELYAGTSLC